MAAPARSDSLTLREIGRFATQTFEINANALTNPRLGMATVAATAAWSWAGGNSALLFFGTILLNLALLAAGKLVSTVSELALKGDQSFSWVERRQRMLFWVSYSLWALSYTVIPLQAVSAAHLASRPFASSSA